MGIPGVTVTDASSSAEQGVSTNLSPPPNSEAGKQTKVLLTICML